MQDCNTSFLYLTDTLPGKQPRFFPRFDKVLHDCGIKFAFLSNTKDIWARDFMPVQITKDRFVQFTYNPDYLRNYKKWRKTISDVNGICKAIDLKPSKSDILVDGGNVVRSKDKVIMCDKVFKENPGWEEKKLIKELEKLLEIDKLVLIPTDPHDEFGHADGMASFLDENTVLINEYSKYDDELRIQLISALHNANLNWIEVPYNPYYNKKKSQANGIYINYLQMKNIVIVPTFKKKEDDSAVKLFEGLFKEKRIEAIESSEIASEGGVLNCISWNIAIAT